MRTRSPLPWRVAVTVPALLALTCVWQPETASSTAFAPGATIKMCAYDGANLQTPCPTENLVAGANADMTMVFSAPSGIAPSTIVTFLPARREAARANRLTPNY
jgi:hypothetical protein